MDSQFSDSPAIFNPLEFKPLLEADGNILKRMLLRKSEKMAKSFYDDYVSWCRKNGKYIDFIQPLYCHLYCCGVPLWIVNMYMKSISSKIMKYLRKDFKENG